jgi:hypothetical protein
MPRLMICSILSRMRAATLGAPAFDRGAHHRVDVLDLNVVKLHLADDRIGVLDDRAMPDSHRVAMLPGFRMRLEILVGRANERPTIDGDGVRARLFNDGDLRGATDENRIDAVADLRPQLIRLGARLGERDVGERA